MGFANFYSQLASTKNYFSMRDTMLMGRVRCLVFIHLRVHVKLMQIGKEKNELRS